jgi:ADP-heptose:LPS heptosyltransferase
MKTWNECKNILCIRADNAGDVIMSGPAIRALKKFTGAKITLLTSRMGNLITPCMEEIDETLVYDLPWCGNKGPSDESALLRLLDVLRSCQFDAAVVFTVYSQSALPAALSCFLAGIPRRLAYCRENPYHLLTDWIPDEEPYTKIVHQVQRDLSLVAHVGATISDDRLSLRYSSHSHLKMKLKLIQLGMTSDQWIIAHPGVSEEKRAYPTSQWKETVQLLRDTFHLPVIITGSAAEKYMIKEIQNQEEEIFSAAGLFTMEEFVSLVGNAQLVVSVNTATVHIAAAQKIPVVVLYAMTNPQHTPWKTDSKVLYFPVAENKGSKNEVIRYVGKYIMDFIAAYPTPQDIVHSASSLLKVNHSIPQQA